MFNLRISLSSHSKSPVIKKYITYIKSYQLLSSLGVKLLIIEMLKGRYLRN